MKIELTTISGKTINVSNVNELCFTQSVNAPCDSLWCTFISPDEYVQELKTVRAYEGDKLVFNGYVDCQKNKFSLNGYEVFFYARSSACLLVDNEAEPFTYEKASAKQLCHCIAGKYGFTLDTDEIFTDSAYEVEKGVSCFGAINQFVSFITGSHLVVTPQNVIKTISPSENIKSLNNYDILSLEHTINRSEPYSQINFKKEYSHPRYNVHTKSGLAEELGIEREHYVSLSALPQWQRELAVAKKLRSSFENYQLLTVVIQSYFDGQLLERYSLDGGDFTLEDFALYEKKFICDKGGERTVLVLKKNIDIKELTYVD